MRIFLVFIICTFLISLTFLQFNSIWAGSGFSFDISNQQMDKDNFIEITGTLQTDFEKGNLSIIINDDKGNFVDTVTPTKVKLGGAFDITFKLPASANAGGYSMKINGVQNGVNVAVEQDFEITIPLIDSIILESVKLKCETLNIEDIDCNGITLVNIPQAIEAFNDFQNKVKEVSGDFEQQASEAIEQIQTDSNGGCLIATATFGSELAPQVQSLRELRDNTLLATSSGASFMTGFNAIYYSFSPAVADLERQNPIFKEAVKVTITPLITSLSLLNYVEIDSDQEVLGYGIVIILLNIGIYFIAPAIILNIISKKFWNNIS